MKYESLQSPEYHNNENMNTTNSASELLSLTTINLLLMFNLTNSTKWLRAEKHQRNSLHYHY